VRYDIYIYIYVIRRLKVKVICIQRFSKMKLTMKLKTDGPELPATDSRILSI
jgi:hypothetical protein